jgi:hypothetical protein
MEYRVRGTSGGGKGKQKACMEDTSTQQTEASSIYAEFENIYKRMEPYRMWYIDIEGVYRRLKETEQLLEEKDAIIQKRDIRIKFLE